MEKAIRITGIESAIAYLQLIAHVFVLSKCGKFAVVSNACKRCGGVGRISTFSYVEDGICFECNGINTENSTKMVPIVQYARAQKSKEAARLRRLEKAAAANARHEQREQARAAKLESLKQAARDASKHLGTVGKREVFEIKVKKVLEFGGYYGATFLHICETTSGSVVIYKTGSRLDVREGATIRVKATVSEHTERDGVAQTVIKRAKLTHTLIGGKWLDGGTSDIVDTARSIVCALLSVSGR